MVSFVDVEPVALDCVRCAGSGVIAADWCSACGGCGSDWFDRSALFTLAHNLAVAGALRQEEDGFMSRPSRPRHKHDCDACEFLGFVDGSTPRDPSRSEEWDLWFC